MTLHPQAALDASRLPTRWRGRPIFVVLDLDFGAGENFLALWQAWLHDSHRCERLVVVALAAAPPPDETGASGDTGAPRDPAPPLAQRLRDAWPPAVAGWHPLVFEGGRVRLLLRLGPCRALHALRELPMQADAFFLGPPAPPADSRWLAKALARAAAPDATVVANGLSPQWQADLVSSGFRFDARASAASGPASGPAGTPMGAPMGAPIDAPMDTPVASRGHYAPRFAPRRTLPSKTLEPPAPPDPTAACDALVIGAGLAGAATAAALAGWGWSTRVLDRQPHVAAGASGNPAGLYHGIVHAGDGLHARLFRAAALVAQRCYEPLIATGQVPGGSGGLLRLADEDLPVMQQHLARQHLPCEYVQALGRDAASARAGVPLPGPAWWYPGGGWLAPAALVAHWMRTPGVSFHGGMDVAAIRRGGALWQALDGSGRLLAQAGVLVLAGAESCLGLQAPHGAGGWPLQRSRGQVSGWARGSPHSLRLPVAGDGYALPLSSDGLLCGATSDPGDISVDARDSDDAKNFQRLARLTGLTPPSSPMPGGPALRRVGWRLQSGDRLPVAGAVPTAIMSTTQAGRLSTLARVPGLFVLTALGSRGITWAPLMGELVAAQIVGAVQPLERGLAEAVDPARWLSRAARRAARPADGLNKGDE